MESPWGDVDYATVYADGEIHLVTTPSHGGFIVTPKYNTRIDPFWKEMTFAKQGYQGYYEEDEDWAFVVVSFPRLFDMELVDKALRTVANAVDRRMVGIPRKKANNG